MSKHREYLYGTVPLGAGDGTHQDRHSVWIDPSHAFLTICTDHLVVSRGSPGESCSMELPKDVDQTAPGMINAIPSLGLYPHWRKTVNCNRLLTHGCSVTKDQIWLEPSVSEGHGVSMLSAPVLHLHRFSADTCPQPWARPCLWVSLRSDLNSEGTLVSFQKIAKIPLWWKQRIF